MVFYVRIEMRDKVIT